MAGGGGAWKVAYADFVTAMMAFFMVMWLTSQRPDLAKPIAQYFNDPWAKYKINSNSVRKPTLFESKASEKASKKKSMGANPKAVPHDEPELPDSPSPKILTVRAAERTTEGCTVQFIPGTDELTAESKDRLKRLVPRLQGLPQKIDVRGHVSTQAASKNDNDDEAMRLSFERALVVKRFLVNEGIAGDRMRTSQGGPYEPVSLSAENGADEDRNSRVEVFLLAETVESLKGNKAQRDKTETLDEKAAQTWLEENGAAEPAANGHGEGSKKGH